MLRREDLGVWESVGIRQSSLITRSSAEEPGASNYHVRLPQVCPGGCEPPTSVSERVQVNGKRKVMLL